MNRNMALLLVGGGALAWLLYSQRQPVADTVQSGVEDVQAAIQGWKQVNQGPQWVPVLAVAEVNYGIPTDVLARVAYQESRFRQDVIDGSTASGAGALGLMQLMPRYFTSVQGPRPFTPADTAAQIEQAAAQLAQLAKYYGGDWGLALAAYNDGAGNIDAYLAHTRTLPAETASYVADILTDVPLAGATLPA